MKRREHVESKWKKKLAILLYLLNISNYQSNSSIIAKNMIALLLTSDFFLVIVLVIRFVAKWERHYGG